MTWCGFSPCIKQKDWNSTLSSFPISPRPRGNSGDRAVFSDRWGILAGASYGLHRKPLPHSLILENKAEDEDQQYEEEKRLLYVAITRARKMLVLGEGFTSRGGYWLQWVEQLF